MSEVQRNMYGSDEKVYNMFLRIRKYSTIIQTLLSLAALLSSYACEMLEDCPYLEVLDYQFCMHTTQAKGGQHRF